MKEADVRAEVFNLMRRLWLWPITQVDTVQCPGCGRLHHPPTGRPDILGLNPAGRSIVVEVKTFPEPRKSGGWEQASCTFPFSAIQDNQRQWLKNFDEDNIAGSSYGGAYLALGTRHGTAGAKKNPRYLWLIPWYKWLRVEDKLRTYQESLPLSVIKGLRKEIQENNLTAYGLLKQWSLEWQDGHWHLPVNHPLQVFIACQEERDLYKENLRWRS